MSKRSTILISLAIVALIVAIYIAMIVLAPSGAEFGGTDATANDMLTAEPWFEPLFAPGDIGGELESGLFALQAGLGGAIFGFAAGRLARGKAAKAE